MLNMNNISFNCDGTSISGSEGGDSGVVSVGDIWSWYYWFIVSVVFYQLWFNSIWTFLFYHKYINYIGVTVRYVPYKFVIFHHSLIYDEIYTQPHVTLIFLHLLFEFIFFVSQKQYIFSCLITAFPHLDMKLKDWKIFGISSYVNIAIFVLWSKMATACRNYFKDIFSIFMFHVT